MEDNNFEECKTLDEMINHLKESKRVVFNEINEEEAKEILYKHNYINVITPFKYKFAKKEKGILIKECGKHIYEKEIDFYEYFEYHKKEREPYITIFRNIINFETPFKSITSFETINFYQLNNEYTFNDFIDTIVQQINLEIGKTGEKDSLINKMNHLKDTIKKTNSIYLLFDRLSLTEILTIFRFIDKKIKSKIFRILLDNNLTFNINNIDDFEKTIKKIISIRNCVCHSNSLEILKRYYKPENKELRKDTDNGIYRNLIEKLSR